MIRKLPECLIDIPNVGKAMERDFLLLGIERPVDTLHAIPTETVGSRLAYPTEIHVQVTDQWVEVKGKLKRKGHKNQSLRGHVDVELLDTIGRVMGSKKHLVRVGVDQQNMTIVDIFPLYCRYRGLKNSAYVLGNALGEINMNSRSE